MRGSVEDRTARLAGLVSIDLANPVSNKFAVQANIDMLLRLGLGDQARDFFLTARTVIIRHRIRLLKFDGDISSYIAQLSEIVFRLIRNTCDWYGGSFHDTTMASGFMKWVHQELEHFAEVFRRQVFDSKQNFTVIADCLQHAMEQCRQLRDVGLDLCFVLDHLFHADIVSSIDAHVVTCRTQIVKAVVTDKFSVVIPEGKAEIPARVSQSVHDFYAILSEFGADMSLIVTISLYTKIVWCLSEFFTTFINKLLEVCEKGWNNQHCGVILVDARFVVDDILPKVSAQLA
ncbi:exocyst complex component exo84, partial [Borealophlyctis nickersoniae]